MQICLQSIASDGRESLKNKPVGWQCRWCKRMGYLRKKAFEHGDAVTVLKASFHPIQACFEPSSRAPFRDETAETGEENEFVGLRQCAVRNQMPAQGMGDEHT